MADFYFERYREQAAAFIEEGQPGPVSNGTLIQGIEDIGGAERTAIAHAVPREAAVVAQALLAAEVRADNVIEHPLHNPRRNYAIFKVGWTLGRLVDGAPYATADGSVRRESGAGAMLSIDGTLFAYSSRMPSQPVASGRKLNRYAPVCATSMNDRAVLFGLAAQTVMHDLEIPRAS